MLIEHVATIKVSRTGGPDEKDQNRVASSPGIASPKMSSGYT